MKTAAPALALLVATGWLAPAGTGEPAALGGRVEPAPPWGADGHEMAARAASAALPAAMPDFFRSSGERLAYLNPEPDRWRNRSLREMAEAFSYDHYIDLERVPDGALESGDRYVFLRTLYEAGIERPEADVGLLPYRILELYQRLVTEWRLWSRETDPERRTWIEQRILDDAGILGHYVTDASQPHHTTIHFNGWDSDTPNPEGYTDDRTFHARFESDYVSAHITQADVDRYTGSATSVAGEVRGAVLSYIDGTFQTVEELYRLDRDVGFDPDETARDEARTFAARRLGVGATMLAMLWRSAWEEGTR